MICRPGHRQAGKMIESEVPHITLSSETRIFFSNSIRSSIKVEEAAPVQDFSGD